MAETADGAEVCRTNALDRHARVAPEVGMASDGAVVERVDEYRFACRSRCRKSLWTEACRWVLPLAPRPVEGRATALRRLLPGFSIWPR